MRSRTGLVLATALSSLLAAVMAAPANAAPPAGSGGVLIAESKKITVVNLVSLNGDATVAVTPPQSFCYVGVNQPTLGADRRLTETWWLDCRSNANPEQPAPDIASVYMKVRIYNGSPSAWEPGTMVGGTECWRYSAKPTCSATTYNPVQNGLWYYTRLDVTVTLTGGTVHSGCFVTDPISFV